MGSRKASAGASRKEKPGRPRDVEARLDASILQLLGKGEADYTPSDWRSLREELRLTLLYPGRFVAFRDHHRGKGEARRLVRREVLHSSRSLAAAQRRLAELPEREQQGVTIHFVEPARAEGNGQ